MEQENKLLRQQFEIAWRALQFYKLEANPLRANDAVARILALGPVETQGETTKPWVIASFPRSSERKGGPMSWLRNLWNLLFGTKSADQPAVSAPSSPSPTPAPAPNPAPAPAAFNRLEWTKKALAISKAYEGSDGWANITGNFDGTGLTCGALGWTMKWNSQDWLVKTFVARHGETKARALMPTAWATYWKAINAGEAEGMALVAPWSNGSSKVKEPYQSELRALWNSPEMIAIQIEAADSDMGAYSEKNMRAFCPAPRHRRGEFPDLRLVLRHQGPERRHGDAGARRRQGENLGRFRGVAAGAFDPRGLREHEAGPHGERLDLAPAV
jgi:hypothetical protein